MTFLYYRTFLIAPKVATDCSIFHDAHSLKLVKVRHNLWHTFTNYFRLNLYKNLNRLGYLKLSFKYGPADYDTLNLAGTFINLGDLSIPHQALNVEFFYISVTAMYLNCFISYFLGNI